MGFQRGESRCEAVEYSEEFKAAMVRKMLPPNARSASELAEEVNLPQPTLSRWLREARSVGGMTSSRSKQWTTAEKLRVLLEAEQLDDDKLGELLRREGLHEAQLKGWREDVEAALSSGRKSAKPSPEARRVKELERELHRKEKALAEAAALLILKKKADALWGEEDDDTTKGNGR